MRFESILEWFSGKARDTIVTFTIPALIESEQLGYWKKGVARTVRATLNKQNAAQKLARAIEVQFGTTDRWSSLQRLSYDHPLHDGTSDMLYGSFGRAPRHLTPEAKVKRDARGVFTLTLKDGSATSANEIIERWARSFAPVAELIELLDARRPKPVFVMKTLSPTVAQNLSEHIGIDIATLQVPPMHGEYVEIMIKGRKVSVYVIVIDWPEGTLHDRSRFVHNANHEQCQACGHAIKDPYNWVPILAYSHLAYVDTDTTARVPYSLWVGRDCAKKLFGCEVEGDAIYQQRSRLELGRPPR